MSANSGCRGITLTELTIVMVLAALVMTGLVTFYINSQNMWMDGSQQAMIQRDGTLLLEAITKEARRSKHALPILGAAPGYFGLELVAPDDKHSTFKWNKDDSLVYFSRDSSSSRPVVNSRIGQFLVDSNDTLVFVSLKMMPPKGEMVQGEPVQMSTTIALYNQGHP